MTNSRDLPLDKDGLPDIYSPNFPNDEPLPIELTGKADQERDSEVEEGDQDA